MTDGTLMWWGLGLIIGLGTLTLGVIISEQHPYLGFIAMTSALSVFFVLALLLAAEVFR